MEDRYSLEINVPSDYIAPQFMCFPLVAVRANPDARNWYYQNYMMPVARLDGINRLGCEISDAITYGAGGNTYNKVMRLSNINRVVCSQFGDIISVLRENIGKRYYCVLFLDFYYLSCAEVYYGKHHFIHEVLFYGYDNMLENFSCYGYFEHLYRVFSLPYGEVRQAFDGALKHNETMDGWEEYMMITMRKFGHRMPSPYSNGMFLDKLETYVTGEVTEQFRHDNLMYLKPWEHSVSCAGRRVNEIFLKYIDMLMELPDEENMDDRIVSQMAAFNVFKCCHNDMADRLVYYSERNGGKQELGDFIQEYQSKVARKSAEIRMAYIKFLCLIEKKMSVKKMLERLRNELSELDRHEEDILYGFLHKARQISEAGQ